MKGPCGRNNTFHVLANMVNYKPVRHDMMRQTNDFACSGDATQSEVFLPGRPSPRAAGSTWSSARGSDTTLPQTSGFKSINPWLEDLWHECHMGPG